MPHVNKKITSEKLKFNSTKKVRPRMSCEWIGKNHSQKIRSKKLKKTVKIRVKLPKNCKKSLPRNRIFVQTPFSHSTLKLERKKFTIHAAKPLAFSLYFLFRRDQNHYSNLASKIMKMCEQILKKDSAPIQFKFFEL